MSNLIDQIPKIVVSDAWENKDTRAPKRLEVLEAKYGYFSRPTFGPEKALLVQLKEVEAGSEIQMLNLSKNPGAKWGADEQPLPVDTLHVMESGSYTAVFGPTAADRLSIAPGDVLEFRQVDAAGNASPATRVKLDQRDGGYTQFEFHNADFVFQDGVDLPSQPGGMGFRPVWDNRAPVVLPHNMAFHFFNGQAMLTADHALEPGATLQLHNLRTHQTVAAEVGPDRKLSVRFKAAIGDPIHIVISDAHAVASNALTTSDLGISRFAPVMSALDSRIRTQKNDASDDDKK